MTNNKANKPINEFWYKGSAWGKIYTLKELLDYANKRPKSNFSIGVFDHLATWEQEKSVEAGAEIVRLILRWPIRQHRFGQHLNPGRHLGVVAQLFVKIARWLISTCKIFSVNQNPFWGEQDNPIVG